jgi:hypothetical protein
MNKKWYGVIAVGLALAVAVALVSPWASSHPDGLEKVAEDEEFIDTAKDNGYEIIPDYTFPGVENERVATILSGLVGIVIVAAVCFGLVFLMRVTSKGGGASSSQES